MDQKRVEIKIWKLSRS